LDRFLNLVSIILGRVDKTSVNLVSIVLGGVGLFVVLMKFNVPELNLTYLGTNPFAIKRDAIESVMTWLFTGLTLVGLLIQVGAAIWGDRLPERVHALRVYVALFVVTLMVAVVLVLLLNSLGNWLARARWLPQAVENQNDVYRSARFVIEHDGWRDDQLAVKATLPDPEHYRRGNFETAARQVEQIEKLLDIPVRTTDLKVRLDALKPFFERHQRGAR